MFVDGFVPWRGLQGYKYIARDALETRGAQGLEHGQQHDEEDVRHADQA